MTIVSLLNSAVSVSPHLALIGSASTTRSVFRSNSAATIVSLSVRRGVEGPPAGAPAPPVRGRTVAGTDPAGIVSDAGWVIADAGRGAAYAGTRRSGTPLPWNSTMPLASAWYSRGSPPWVRATVGSIVLVS